MSLSFFLTKTIANDSKPGNANHTQTHCTDHTHIQTYKKKAIATNNQEIQCDIIKKSRDTSEMSTPTKGKANQVITQLSQQIAQQSTLVFFFHSLSYFIMLVYKKQTKTNKIK